MRWLAFCAIVGCDARELVVIIEAEEYLSMVIRVWTLYMPAVVKCGHRCRQR